MAIVLDGIDALRRNDNDNENRKPASRLTVDSMPKMVKKQWIGEVLQKEQQYAVQQKTAAAMAALFHRNGIRTYVLKGDVVAECYPKPSHRVSVDLDCFLTEANEDQNDNVWERGNRLIEEVGFEVSRGFYKNSSFYLPGLHVENHQFLTPFRGNKRLKSLERLLQRLINENDNDNDNRFEGTWLYRPPVMVSALFLIEHAYSHFLHEGLTWRHVLDWMMFSKKHREEIDWRALETYLDEFGFRKFYETFDAIGKEAFDENDNHNDNSLTPNPSPKGEGDLELPLTSDFLHQKKRMLADIWAPLDLHETVRGLKGKLALAGNTWRARWKYREFTDVSWLTALWIQVKGFLFMKHPTLN